MSFNYHHLINLHIIFSFSVICLLVSNVKCHKCYVCGGDADPNCNKFDPNKNIYVKECPDDTTSCSSHRTENGDVIQRACESLPLNDCKEANKIKYCYCLQELCNIDIKIQETTTVNPNIDDEDDNIEGSGGNTRTELGNDVFFETTPATKSVNAASIRSSSLVLLLTCLFY